jgi:hypothetical protein
MHVFHLHLPLHFGDVPASVEYKNSLGAVKTGKVRRRPGERVTSVRCRAKRYVVPQHVVGLENFRGFLRSPKLRKASRIVLLLPAGSRGLSLRYELVAGVISSLECLWAHAQEPGRHTYDVLTRIDLRPESCAGTALGPSVALMDV